MLEFVISIVGVVMFFAVILRVWFWVNRTIIERQASFQHSRLAAGQPETAGKPVPYQRPRIRLFGTTAGSTGGDLPEGYREGDREAPCDAARPFFDNAKALRSQAEAWLGTAKDLERELQTWKDRADRAGRELQACDSDDDDCIDRWQNELQIALAEVERLTNEILGAQTQANTLSQEAMDELERGMAACP